LLDDGKTFFYRSDGRRISGVVNFPLGSEKDITYAVRKYPVIFLIHGFADVKEYYPGFGTERVAKYLADRGYVAFASDFLDYGKSDSGTKNDFENRFLTYTTNLDLIASVEKICSGCKVGIWGHSNGGQIALSILAISGKDYPTVLWNPVTKPFPYSILFFTDTFEDRGKWLRRALSEFESDYDVEKYSTTNYLPWVVAPIFIMQGEDDEWVPKRWSDDIFNRLKELDKDVEYRVYLGSDHKMIPKWNEAVVATERFYASKMKVK
jgi:alpha-beta hydrolase superfamily lysophospholipase